MTDAEHRRNPQLPSKSRRMLKRYGWTALGVAAVAGVALSLVGFWEALDPDRTSVATSVFTRAMDAIYKSLLGFWFNAADANAPWPLQVGRMLTLIAAAVLGGKIIVDLLQQEARRGRARRMSDHVIVCGAGELGSAAADAILSSGRAVTVVDAVTSSAVESLGRRGAGVVIGDATDPLTLLEAGADRAHHLLACCGDDDRNASIAEAAHIVIADVGRDPSSPLALRLHIDDPDLLRQLRPCMLEIGAPGLDIDFFSVAEIAAAAVVDSAIPDEFARGACDYDAAIVGGAVLAEHILLGLADRAPSRPGSADRPVVALVCPSADGVLDRAAARGHHLDAHLRVKTVDTAELGPEAPVAALVRAGVARFGRAFVCTTDDGETVRHALALTAAIRRLSGGLTVVACIYGRSGIASLVGRAGNSMLRVVDATDAVRDPDLITLDTVERLARMVHESYFADELKKPAAERTAKFVPWDALDPETRDDNRDHVRSFFKRLSEAGLRLVPLGSQDEEPIEITGDVLELLAQNEHARWCKFKSDHGWHYGERDDKNKVHNCLAPWEQLKPMELQDKDRRPIKRMPHLLKRAGIALVEADPAR